MNWKAHLAIGFVFCLFFVGVMNVWQGWYLFENTRIFVAIILLSLISPLVPDLDTEKGKLHRVLFKIAFFVALFSGLGWVLTTKYAIGNVLSTVFPVVFASGCVFLVLLWISANFWKHRGFTHTVLFALLYGGFIFLILGFDWQLGILATVGCYIHNLLDGVVKLV